MCQQKKCQIEQYTNNFFYPKKPFLTTRAQVTDRSKNVLLKVGVRGHQPVLLHWLDLGSILHETQKQRTPSK